jgi:hypothetical protein
VNYRIGQESPGILADAVRAASNHVNGVQVSLRNEMYARTGDHSNRLARAETRLATVVNKFNILINKLNHATASGESFTNHYGITLPAQIQ